MRWLLLLLAGCDQFITLTPHYANPFESSTHDEDMDDIVDAIDLCPHTSGHGYIDNDNDGIANECDPRPDAADERYFFSFESGNTARLNGEGRVATGDDMDSIVLGVNAEPYSALVLPIDVEIANISMQVRIIETAVETGELVSSFSEVGIHSAHRSFSDQTLRGDTCFTGVERGSPNLNYVELKQDNIGLGRETFPAPFTGLGGEFVQERSPEQLSCTVVRDSDSAPRVSSTEIRATPNPITGSVAISARFLRARISWLWIVTPKRL